MSVKVTEELTRKVADLARLELTSAEISTFTQQLKDVLQHIAELEEVNVEGVEAMTHSLVMETPEREDSVQSFPLDNQGHPKVLSSAPEVIYEGYKVPPIL